MHHPKFMFHLTAESQNILYNLINNHVPARASPHSEQGVPAAQQSRADAIQKSQIGHLALLLCHPVPGPLQPLMGLTQVKENTAILIHR